MNPQRLNQFTTQKKHKNDNCRFRGGTVLLLGITATLAITSEVGASLVNGSFELPLFSPGVASVDFPNEALVPGWETTATDDTLEIWSDGFNGVFSSHGNQHAELNAFQVSTLFQDSTAILAGSQVGFTFDHRGRAGVDTLRLTITDLGLDNVPGGLLDTVLFTNTYATGNTAWVTYSGVVPTPTLGNTIRFAYESVSAAGGNSTIGNFLDNADFGVGVSQPPAVPEPATGLAGLACALAATGRRRRK